MTPPSRQERLAINEARVREVNETIELANEKLGPAPGADDLSLSILCECGTRGCDQVVEISSTDYRAVRAEPTQFVVVQSHAQPQIEQVVDQRRGFAVVEKVGAAADVAERTDPEDPAAPSTL